MAAGAALGSPHGRSAGNMAACTPESSFCSDSALVAPAEPATEAALPGACPTSSRDYLWSPASSSEASSQGAAAAAGSAEPGPHTAAAAAATSRPVTPVPEAEAASEHPAPLGADVIPFGEPGSPAALPFVSSPPALPPLHPLGMLDALSMPPALQDVQAPAAAEANASASSPPGPSEEPEGAEQEQQGERSRMLFAQPICRLTSAVPSASGDPKRNAPCPRFGHTAVVYKDQMVVYGGRDARCHDDVWTYSFLTQQWQKIDTTSEEGRPRARAGHTAVVHKSTMYVFGGVAEREGGSHTLWLNDLWTLDLESWRWAQVRCRGGMIPDTRKGHTAVATRRSMVVYGGGQDDQTMHGDLWEFVFATQKWLQRSTTGHTPQARMYHVAVMGPANRMIVFGGRADTTPGFLNDVFEIDLSNYVCTELNPTGPVPTHRMCSTAVYHNYTLAIFTGGSYAYHEDSHQLDLRKMEWMPIDNVRFGGRTRPTTVKWRNTVLTFGGCVHSGNGYVNDCIELELEPMSLKQLMKQALLEHRGMLKGERGIPEALLDYIDD
eukprot:TRINITY_DN2648_c0_g1_i1.p1 TRINITY_DN2648_c0_g1~~TRINITY_DN2648_c0_g1_i1.p1  ORF type:complete len:551 (+),score=144.27 TRINITY_DN2648_c0_g1_i1:105-1757(+)